MDNDTQLELREALQVTSAHTRDQAQLAPVDRGKDAWRVLLAAFIFEALFWGFPTAFGVFQAYYSDLEEFSNNTDNIAVIGTLAQGLYYMGAPIAASLTKRFPKYRNHMIIGGWLCCILGLLTASFATTIPQLVATQGLLYGIGFVTLSYPILDMLSEWWIERKGMAFGLISSASGVTGVAMPLLLDALLHRYGYQITLRACAVAMIVTTAPLLPLLKGRLPLTEVLRRPKTDWSFTRNPLFYVYAAAMTVQGLGFSIPPIFVSSYAVAIGLPSLQAAVLLAVMAAAQTCGQFALGWLSDKKIHASVLSSMCAVVAGVATATFWGLGKSLSMLLLYSIFYGFFAFGFGTLRVAMGRAVTNEQSAVLATYSTFVFVQGIGNILVGPLTAALISGPIVLTEYGSLRYRSTIIFVAASSVAASAIIGSHYTVKKCSTRHD